MPDQVRAEPVKPSETLACKITLGPLTIETEASVAQVAALILNLVKEYPELPIALGGRT